MGRNYQEQTHARASNKRQVLVWLPTSEFLPACKIISSCFQIRFFSAIGRFLLPSDAPLETSCRGLPKFHAFVSRTLSVVDKVGFANCSPRGEFRADYGSPREQRRMMSMSTIDQRIFYGRELPCPFPLRVQAIIGNDEQGSSRREQGGCVRIPRG